MKTQIIKSPKPSRNFEKGFTLIELLVVMVIIGIFAAIAIPSYERYIIKNAEAEAKAKMGQLQVDMDAWRATALTFKGYAPSKVGEDGKTTYTYDDGVNGKLVYIPSGSTNSNYRYVITILDGGNNTDSLNADAANEELDIATGRTWVMVATPNPNRNIIKKASAFVVRNNGFKCKSSLRDYNDTIVASLTTCNGTGQEQW